MIWGRIAQWRSRTLDRQLTKNPISSQQQALHKAIVQVRGCRIAQDWS
jgi:hypothetical protein